MASLQEENKRTRRTKEEVLSSKITKLDETIETYQKKLKVLKVDKAKLESQLAKLQEEKIRVEEEKSMREIAQLLKDKDISLTELKDLIK